jgi:hypothetical protein
MTAGEFYAVPAIDTGRSCIKRALYAQSPFLGMIRKDTNFFAVNRESRPKRLADVRRPR